MRLIIAETDMNVFGCVVTKRTTFLYVSAELPLLLYHQSEKDGSSTTKPIHTLRDYNKQGIEFISEVEKNNMLFIFKDDKVALKKIKNSYETK